MRVIHGASTDRAGGRLRPFPAGGQGNRVSPKTLPAYDSRLGLFFDGLRRERPAIRAFATSQSTI